jgi:hypothetical protein
VAGRTKCGLAGVLSTVTMANPTWGQISARLIRPRKKPEIALLLRTVNFDLTRFLKFSW